MSLDVHLTQKIDPPEEDVCSHCGQTQKIDSREVYWANITHNLSRMAEEAGIYMHCWQPQEIGITKAGQLVEPLSKAIAEMKADRERFEQFNAKNGWGLYENFVPWLERYLEACREYPDATVRASR